MSTLLPLYSLPFTISGAVNSGVPQAACRAKRWGWGLVV